MKTTINNILKFLLLIILQVFFLKNLSIYGLTIPYLYILFIILLPITTPHIVVYSSSFLLGLIIDLFLNTPGVHAATCVITAFIRIIFLNFIEYNHRSDKSASIASYRISVKIIYIYVTTLVVLHGLVLSILESANFNVFLTTIKTSLYNILLTTVIIIIILYLFGVKKLKVVK